MSMSAKDYNIIASVIENQLYATSVTSPQYQERRDTILRMATCLAQQFAVLNPRFDTTIFLYKCKLTGRD